MVSFRSWPFQETGFGCGGTETNSGLKHTPSIRRHAGRSDPQELLEEVGVQATSRLQEDGMEDGVCGE
jgi:hypothetical protein